MKIVSLLALLAITACAPDKTKVINNSNRVSDLERRMTINEQLDAVQSQLIQANADAIAAETAAREAADSMLDDALQQEIADRIAGDADLAALIDAEESARQAGDAVQASNLQIEIANRIAGDRSNSLALAAAVFTQSLTNFALQYSISMTNNRFNLVNSRLSSLESRMSNAESDINQLESDAAQLAIDMANLEASLQSQIDSVAASNAATQAQLNAEGVKLFKCNSSSSTERIMKINGKFYAAMNRVTTESVQVITGSSSSTFSNPKLCLKDEKTKLPGGNGQCPSSWQEVGGNTVTIPAYSVGNRTVVTSVKIAIDILSDGSYATTDGGPACHFTISGGGTSQSGLIAVQ